MANNKKETFAIAYKYHTCDDEIIYFSTGGIMSSTPKQTWRTRRGVENAIAKLAANSDILATSYEIVTL